MKWYQKKYFFGWGNWKMLIIELLKVGSNKPGFFSQKRIHQGISFGILQWGMVYWLVKRMQSPEGMPATEFVIWAGIELTILGYVINEIQKEKRFNNDNNPDQSAGESEKSN